MIDKNRTYRTRDGREVRIYATDGVDDQSIHGAVKDNNNGWILHAWYSDGVHARSDRNGRYDLIEVRPRHKRTVWINMYETVGNQTSHHFKEQADDERDPVGCIACIKVELDFEEGEGL
jgi:hypothetical protein